MRTLVIGATGFIGRHLAAELLAEGHEVRAACREPARAGFLAEEGVEIVRGDLLDPPSLVRAAEGVEVIYDAAGTNRTLLDRDDPDGDAIWRVNALGNLHVARAADRAGARRVVSVSSVFLFGHDPEGPVTEEDVTNLWPYAGPYLMSRIQQEVLLLRAAARTGIEVILCNPAFVVGPGDRGPNAAGRIVAALCAGRLPVLPPGGSSWIGIRDVVVGLRRAATRGVPGSSYIFGSENLSFPELAHRVEALTGVSSPGRVLPASVVRVGGKAASLLAPLLGQRPSIDPAVASRLLAEGFYYDASRAVEELGLPQRPIDRDLTAAIEDLAERGLCPGVRIQDPPGDP